MNTLKTLSTSALAGLLLATTQPALADRDGYRRHDERRPLVVHHNHHSPSHRIGPSGVVLGLAGLAIGSGIAWSVQHRPPVILAPVRPPPVVYLPQTSPASFWYYCDAYRAYYPQVGECPGGWRTVPPH